MTGDYLAIGELGRRTDTKVETIRYYERIFWSEAMTSWAGISRSRMRLTIEIHYRSTGP
jgi:hypothetical protein